MRSTRRSSRNKRSRNNRSTRNRSTRNRSTRNRSTRRSSRNKRSRNKRSRNKRSRNKRSTRRSSRNKRSRNKRSTRKRSRNKRSTRSKIIYKKKSGNCITRSDMTLRDDQKKVVLHLDKHDKLLVVHGTGCGKTLSAVAISQCYLDKYPRHNIIFVGPSSLLDNFKKEMMAYGSWDFNNYQFYSFQTFARRIALSLSVNSSTFISPFLN